MRNSRALPDLERAHTSRDYEWLGSEAEVEDRIQFQYFLLAARRRLKWNRPVGANARGMDTWKHSRTRVLEGSDHNLEKSGSITLVMSLGSVDKVAKSLTQRSQPPLSGEGLQ